MSIFDPDKITFFAKTDARGKEKTFGIKAKDRQRHMYVVGKTGMGKSTLLENMAAQDIQNGEGTAFIDPHGSAAETLLDYVPEHRISDVVYFAPFDLNHPVSFNVMEDVGPDKRHLVVSGLMSTFKKVWVDAWSPRMEYILTNTLFALIEYPDTTLLSVSRMLADKAYRNQVVDYVKDPAVKSFWQDEFANYTDRFAAEALPAIQNKIGQFTLNPLIRNIIGQPKSSFNIREIMDQKKILIMNLSKGLIGETNANLLGSMLTTRIYLAAMSRADLGVEEMRLQPNFYFYVDEFQSFANATFANILSEARKYHLNLIIAHQYIAQMEEEVRDAVFGNVGTTISFRVGPFDGEVLETVYAPQFTATDLVNLGFAQIYLTLMIDGIGSQPFSAKTLPPIQRPAKSHRTQVIAQSRSLYAKDRVEVEKQVDEAHEPIINPNAKNKSDKGSKSKYKNSSIGKKGSPKSKVSNGPSTSEELKAVLAKVAGEHGGGKKEDKSGEQVTGENSEDKSKTDEKVDENKSEKPNELMIEQADKQEEESIKISSDTLEGKREAGDKTEDEKSKELQVNQLDSQQENLIGITSDTLEKPEDFVTKSKEQKREEQRREEERNLKRAQLIQDSFNKPKNSDKRKSSKKKNSKRSNELKEALADVLMKVSPQVTEANVSDKTSNSTPTIRVVKQRTEPTQPVPKPEPVSKSEPAVSEEDGIDIKKVKKMLKPSQPEKSPMNS